MPNCLDIALLRGLIIVITAVALVALAGCPPGDGQGRAVVTPASPERGGQPGSARVASGATDVGADSPAPTPTSGRVIAVTADTFKTEVLEAEGPVIVEFGATWCGPCRMLKPLLDRLAKDYTGKLKFVSVDVDANQALASRYGMSFIPLLVVIEKGRELERFGFLPEAQLRQKIAEVARLAP